jgi:hypothetical protein
MITAWQTRLPLASVRRFVDWWAGELSEALAARSPQQQPWRIMFLRRGKGCDVYARTHERIEQIGTPDTGSDVRSKSLSCRRTTPLDAIRRSANGFGTRLLTGTNANFRTLPG